MLTLKWYGGGLKGFEFFEQGADLSGFCQAGKTAIVGPCLNFDGECHYFYLGLLV